jgi:putative Mn2+ efflux pump MntP
MTAMSPGELVVIILGSVLLVFAGLRVVRNFFSEDAKRERRRRRSNAPIASRSNRPMVKFSVKTKKDRRK